MNILKRYTAVWATLVVILTTGFSVNASANEDALLKMSEEIVANYKAMRAECAQEQDRDMKQLCFYKLRIKAWDYKQAREYVVQHKTPLDASEMGSAYAVNN